MSHTPPVDSNGAKNKVFLSEIAPNPKDVAITLELYQPLNWQVVPIEDGFYRIFMEIPAPRKANK